jgi:hypothetical protein
MIDKLAEELKNLDFSWRQLFDAKKALFEQAAGLQKQLDAISLKINVVQNTLNMYIAKEAKTEFIYQPQKEDLE